MGSVPSTNKHKTAIAAATTVSAGFGSELGLYSAMQAYLNSRCQQGNHKTGEPFNRLNEAPGSHV